MTKITLDNVGSLVQTTTAGATINANFDTIENAFNNTLSRDGTSPNEMHSSLDMNSHQIINLPPPSTANSALRLQDLSTFVGGGTVSNIPAGGSTGELLTKASNTDFDTRWGNLPTETIFNVRNYGADPANTSAVNTVAFAAAVAAAALVKGKVYIPSGTYLGNMVVQDISGLTIEGDGQASVIVSEGSSVALNIFSNAGSGTVNNITVRNLKLSCTTPGAGSTGLRIWNCLFFDIQDIYAFGTIGVSIQGSGFGILTNVQAYAGGGASGLKVGNGGETLTNSGPLMINGGLFEASGATGPAIVIEGDVLGVVFNAVNYQSDAGTQPASITLNGPSSGTPVGSVTFIECHGESNYNTSNTGSDYLIGNTHKFGSVKILGGNAWGQGNVTNYQRDFIKVVAAKSVIVKGVTASKLSNPNGYSRSMIRLETTFPTAGDQYRFEDNIYSGNGSIFSDANSRIVLAEDSASYDTTLINTLALGNALSPSNGGTGLTSLGTGVATFLGTPSSSNLAAAVTDETGSGALVFGTSPTLITPNVGVATATSVNKVAITAPATSATITIPDGVTLTGPASSGTAMTLGNVETVTGAKTFGSAGAVSKFKLAGTTSGTTTLDASATASGTLTLPAATDTLIGKATTDTLTNKTYDTAGTGNSFSINGVAATANTGTGAVARAAGPTFTTPTLGAATATTLNGNTFTTGTYTLTGTAAKTLNFTNSLTLSGTDSTTMTFPTTSATIARTDAANTFTGVQTFNTAIAIGSGGTGDTGTAWTSYTPTVTPSSGSITTYTSNTSSYKTIGKTVFFNIIINITSIGTASGNFTTQIPVAALLDSSAYGNIHATGFGLGAIISAGSTTVTVTSSVGASGLNGNGEYVISGSYQSN